MKTTKVAKKTATVKSVKIGDVVRFVEENGNEHNALVTLVGAPDSVHVVYVNVQGDVQHVHSLSTKPSENSKLCYKNA